MGRILWSAEVFNYSAPTPAIWSAARYGTREQKEEWLAPLMREIRSAFL
jgi:acyl-CoA dehydrogenase